jgi:hypothetical protein
MLSRHDRVLQAGLISVPFISSYEDFPTSEMSARTGKLTLLTGMVIAVASGGGVALSVLPENSSGLVGVAISAALLPPMVNAGLQWGVAALLKFVHRDECAPAPHIARNDSNLRH